MTTNSALPPCPAAAAHLLWAAGVLDPYKVAAKPNMTWDQLVDDCGPGADRRLVALARSLGTAATTEVPIGRILNEVTPRRAIAVVEAVAMAAGEANIAFQIVDATLAAGPWPNWARKWTKVQAATAMIASQALLFPRMTAGWPGQTYDWHHARRWEVFLEAVALAEAFEVDAALVDVGAIVRANHGRLNSTYIVAFATAAGLRLDAESNDWADLILGQAEVDGFGRDNAQLYAC